MESARKDELVDAFLFYDWIISYTNPIVERLYIGNLTIPPYIKDQIAELAETEATKETLENPNHKPNPFLSSASINLLLARLVYEDIPLYKVGDKEISCTADIKHIWKETGLNSDILKWKEYYRIRAYLAPQRQKILKELEKKGTPASTPQDTANQDKFTPFPTPLGTQWHEVKITFIDNEHVKISAKNVTETKHYSQMGFRKGKTCNPVKPVKSWNTFFSFSKNECLKYSQRDKSEIEKDIQDLKKRLKAYFGIQDAPIILEHGYKPVFKVCRSESEGRSVHAFSNSNAFYDDKEDD